MELELSMIAQTHFEGELIQTPKVMSFADDVVFSNTEAHGPICPSMELNTL
jgi:hypothetical protein